MQIDDKTIDKMLKAALVAIDYDTAKAIYGKGWEGSPDEQRELQAHLRGIVRKHLPQALEYRGRVTNLAKEGTVALIEVEAAEHYLHPGVPVMVVIDSERDLDELAAKLTPEQWEQFSAKGVRSMPVAKALLKRRPK